MQTAPLATLPVSFFDPRTGLSALAVQHVGAGRRTVLVYHDSPGPAAARPLLSGIAERLSRDLAAGQSLNLIESSMPEHPMEPFIYAWVSLWSTADAGQVTAGTGRVMSIDAVARACGVEVREIERTEMLVSVAHRPRECAFAGFRQLALGARARRGVEAA